MDKTNKLYAKFDGGAGARIAVINWVKAMLSKKHVDAVFALASTGYSGLPMPSLLMDPDKADLLDPLAPVAPFNAARQASSILRHETNRKIALILRPCEIRALIELVKLNQCTLDNALIIGIECLGRLENDAYLRKMDDDPKFAERFYSDVSLRETISRTCQYCVNFQPMHADITLCTIDLMMGKHLGVSAGSERGQRLIQALGLPTAAVPEKKEHTVAELLKKRQETRNTMMQETSDTILPVLKFQQHIATCLNCYNCRVACPVCYCKTCVFNSDIFQHPPELLLRRADKKGFIKLPSDTTMFHMTRLTHMAHACVNCGQCSSVCPSHIPVADIFTTVAHDVQKLYDYTPGRSLDEPIPYLVVEGESVKGKK